MEKDPNNEQTITLKMNLKKFFAQFAADFPLPTIYAQRAGAPTRNPAIPTSASRIPNLFSSARPLKAESIMITTDVRKVDP